MLRILCFASTVSLVLGLATQGLDSGWIEGGSILLAVVIIVTISAVNSYVQEKQFLKNSEIASQTYIKVRRNASIVLVLSHELQVGDIIEIESGCVLPVDAIVLKAENLYVDESSLTGEAKENLKIGCADFKGGLEGPNSFLISGSKVIQGKGLALVAAVGKYSVFGQIKQKVNQPRDYTQLQIRLRQLAKQIGRITVLAAFLTFTVLLLHYLYDYLNNEEPNFHILSLRSLREIVKFAVLAVSIIVVSVPQGLPLSLTMALAYTVYEMRKERNLVRQLECCETMGEVDCILCDKTGTLTQNKMSVCRIFMQQLNHQTISMQELSETALKLLSVSVSVNTTALPKWKLSQNVLRLEYMGNKTECALLEMLYRLGIDYNKLRLSSQILKTFPFSPMHKMMGTVFKDDAGAKMVFVKGAPEILLPYCINYLNSQSSLAKLSHQIYEIIEDMIEDYAYQSLRTILVAYKEVAVIPSSWEELPRDLTFLALIGIKDPLRNGVKESIQICMDSGVRVRMVTGDNKRTAIAMAKQSGILSQNWYEKDDDCTVMQGKEFREYVGGLVDEGSADQRVQNIENFRRIRDQLCVLARSSPEDKYIMTVGLKQLGHVVAVTGDGSNDAPALRKADIGFAMGISGTDVAKEAADIVLLDDNFRTIVLALKWGRNIFDSIQKFLQFQLTVNLVALAMALIGCIFLGESPLNSIQMLWVNLIVDTLAALALATQAPSDSVFSQKPYPKQYPLISPLMTISVVWQSCWQLAILSLILFKGPEMLGIPSSIALKDWNEERGKHYSIFFNVFIYLQVFNKINCRKIKPDQANPFQKFFSNKIFFFVTFTIITIQMVAVRLSFVPLRVVAVSFKENLLCLLLGSTSLISGLFLKITLPFFPSVSIQKKNLLDK